MHPGARNCTHLTRPRLHECVPHPSPRAPIGWYPDDLGVSAQSNTPGAGVCVCGQSSPIDKRLGVQASSNCLTVLANNVRPPNCIPSACSLLVSIWCLGPLFTLAILLWLPVMSLAIWATI